MDGSRLQARLIDQRLRDQASRISTALDGRRRSATNLDEFFHRLVVTLEPDAFLEVGAFEATASRRIKNALPRCRVVAFEASPVNFAHHSAQVDYAALSVEYLHQAVSDHVGTTTLQLNVDDSADSPAPVGSTSILRHAAAEQVLEVEVPTTTLDDFVTDQTARLALWVDVEGAVGLVLDGAERALRQVDVLKVEVEDTRIWEGQVLAVDVIERLLAAGLHPVTRDVEYATQYNLLCLSERALGTSGISQLLDDHLYRMAHSWSEEPSRLRQSERLRRFARPIRRGLGRLFGS